MNKGSSDLPALVENFENCSHPELSHEEHVQLGYFYLKEQSLLQVLAQFPDKLRLYAESKGAHNLYHETITWAYLTLINERLHTGPNASWEEFSRANPDLLDSKILEKYYPKDVLDSEIARSNFVLPP